MLIDIAMITRQVTAAMHFQDELPEGQHAPGYYHDQLNRGIECRNRDLDSGDPAHNAGEVGQADTRILVKPYVTDVSEIGSEDGGFRLGSGHDQLGSSAGIGDHRRRYNL
jgi:hypothetical protein